VLVVDKPPGPTSHDVVDRVREVLGVRRAGHTGTLDPFASGVLAVCLGRATRLARFLSGGDKLYRATVRLGFATTTDDLHGEMIGAAQEVRVDPAALATATRGLLGTGEQLAPVYSAKRVGGRRLYDLAREGVEAPRPVSRVTVHSFDVLSVDGDRVEIEVRCSPGTYVRALARDLGAALGVGGHLVALRRVRSGPFGLERAVDGGRLTRADRERVVPMNGLLLDMPEVRVGPPGRGAVGHGRDLDRALLVSPFPEKPEPRWRVLDEAGELLALAVPRGFTEEGSGLPVSPVLHPDVVLVD
jgi:tRNA pseudouridine55 synthase